MNQATLINVEHRGNDIYAHLPVRRQWIDEGQTISVEIPGGIAIQVTLHAVMKEGAILRLKGQAFEGNGDLLLRICISTDEGGRATQSETTAEAGPRERKKMRRIMTFWAFGAGLLFVWFWDGWLINGVPARWIGYLFIAIGVLDLIGFNTFRGGPLDERLDPSG
jgi:hypothetical protein